MPIVITRPRLLAPIVSCAFLSFGPSSALAQFAPGMEYFNQPALATINALDAYKAGLSGTGVRIGIVDSGINPDHLEFTHAIVAAYDGMTGSSGTGNFSSFMVDYNGHGSHVASIAAGRLDGAVRPGNLQGVAYNARLVIGAWGDDRDLAVENSLNYVSAQGVRVINNSWGFVEPGEDVHYVQEHRKELIQALNTAVDRDSVIVFATGNFGEPDPIPPALLPSYDAQLAAKGGWIAVAATNNAGDHLAYYSNKCGVAKNYCIAAPGGEQQFKNDPEGIPGADASTNDGYVYWQGTSMATPVVTGAVALVAEQFPWMTNKNLATTILTTGSRAENPDAEWGRGLLDVGKAIKGPGIFEEDFSANVTAGHASVFSNDISGTAGLIKQGSGTLTLTGNNSYSGNTYLQGGELVAFSQANLGSSTNALQFDGGTLKFGADFTLARDLRIGAGGGTLHLNGYAKTQSGSIAGTGQFGVTGGGSYTLDRANTQQGGLAVGGGSQVNAQRDAYLGAAGSKVALDNGRLNLSNNFVAVAPGIFDRPLEIGAGNGTIDTGNNALAYTGGEISGGGTLSFAGTPFTLGSSLRLNGVWNASLDVPSTLTLGGNGRVNGDLAVAGILSPGNSSGTLTVTGSVVNAPGSTFNVEIDGAGTGIGAGNHDRLVLTGAMSTYTAGGALNLSLRGTGGAAHDTCQPSLGQGFQIVTAPGGVLGSYASFAQPGDGLPPGTRMDLVYGDTALTLYATPASYADLSAAGIENNQNRRQVGAALEGIRPDAGIRAGDAETKLLFDSLAPQTRHGLPISLDQLGGVGYAQLIGMNVENARFLTEQTMAAVSGQRRRDAPPPVAPAATDTLSDAGEEVWATALGRSSHWGSDALGYSMDDDLSGIMAGTQKRLDARTLAGFSLAYAGSDPGIRRNMGSASVRSVQLMGYASRTFEDGFFLQGAFGGGAGRIDGKRAVSMLGSRFDANIDTANVSLSALAGWATGDQDSVRHEVSFGVNYLALRSFGFKDSGRYSFAELRGDAATNNSLTATLGGRVSVPLKAGGIDWRLSALAGLSHEFADTRTELAASLLGQPYEVESGAIGRDRMNLGLGVSGHVAKRTRIGIDLGYQSAHRWEATAATLSAQVAF